MISPSPLSSLYFSITAWTPPMVFYFKYKLSCPPPAPALTTWERVLGRGVGGDPFSLGQAESPPSPQSLPSSSQTFKATIGQATGRPPHPRPLYL